MSAITSTTSSLTSLHESLAAMSINCTPYIYDQSGRPLSQPQAPVNTANNLPSYIYPPLPPGPPPPSSYFHPHVSWTVSGGPQPPSTSTTPFSIPPPQLPQYPMWLDGNPIIIVDRPHSPYPQPQPPPQQHYQHPSPPSAQPPVPAPGIPFIVHPPVQPVARHQIPVGLTERQAEAYQDAIRTAQDLVTRVRGDENNWREFAVPSMFSEEAEVWVEGFEKEFKRGMEGRGWRF